MNVIPSYDQAKAIGEKRFGKGKFLVFQYTQKSSKLTLFGAECLRTEERVWMQ